MKPVSIVMAAVGVALVMGVVWVLGPGARWVLEHVDGVAIGGRTGLSGKDLAAAVDAVRGRVLAVATGLAALAAVYYTARNADTARRTFQLGERGHVTDRYGKAVEQLGSAQAPVRLGGLYALEQLAQDNPDPDFRQTVVDVICAYLRMPYTPPPDGTDPAEPAVPRAALGGVTAPASRDPHEERQVRLTAQRILTAHLRYQDPPARRWWQFRTPDTDDRHWPGIRLDLTGATLMDLDLDHCRVSDARFDGATFTGHAGFNTATFTGYVVFNTATFTGRTGFNTATFIGDAWFGEATFIGNAWFDKATFTGYAGFGEATFIGDAGFREATFIGYAGFREATFTGDAGFREATFTGHAQFHGATFTGYAWFGEATFIGNAWFDKATFTSHAEFREATFTRGVGFAEANGLERAYLGGARVAPAQGDVERVWPAGWQVVNVADGWQTLRLAVPGEESEEEGGEAGPGGDAGDGQG
ncbi:pentapeptide repeat-containing protein [Nonomuraea sp. NPDC049625]|uniref:pentapeptide repeat-containing protein n=1 Tax=Nonomuraea sp. NPDC049625 TaxID=3155775 RepID=UPI00341CBE04